MSSKFTDSQWTNEQANCKLEVMAGTRSTDVIAEDEEGKLQMYWRKGKNLK